MTTTPWAAANEEVRTAGRAVRGWRLVRTFTLILDILCTAAMGFVLVGAASVSLVMIGESSWSSALRNALVACALFGLGGCWKWLRTDVKHLRAVKEQLRAERAELKRVELALDTSQDQWPAWALIDGPRRAAAGEWLLARLTPEELETATVLAVGSQANLGELAVMARALGPDS